MRAIRQQAVNLVQDVSGDRVYNDVNFVFPTWVTTQLPIGLVGIVIAAIFAAAMSAIVSGARVALDGDGDRLLPALDPSDGRGSPLPDRVALRDRVLGRLRVGASRSSPRSSGSLIEVVNRFGSFFYGSILGVFLLAIGWKRATGNGAFVGLIAGMARRRPP